MKPINSEFEIGTLHWISVFLLIVAAFMGLLRVSANWEVSTPMLSLVIGFALGQQVTRIFKAQEKRISELERKVG